MGNLLWGLAETTASVFYFLGIMLIAGVIMISVTGFIIAPVVFLGLWGIPISFFCFVLVIHVLTGLMDEI